MKLTDITLADVSVETKVETLGVVLDKKLSEIDSQVSTVTKLVGPQGPKGEKGDKGATGPQGIAGKDGKDGLNGKDGKDGADGDDGKAGVSVVGASVALDGSLVLDLSNGGQLDVGEVVGPAGPGGLNGAQGPMGLQGPQGEQGIQGPAGDTGATGPQGEQGIQGIQGVAGPTGPQGIQGVKGDTGDTGATGAPGTSVNIKGEVATVGALPSSGNSIGDAYIVTADGNLYTWTESAWLDVGQIVGPQGATGPQGPQGIQGVKGDTGDTGPQGIQGIQGVKGDTGPQGPQGIQGLTGDTGPTGPQGIQGIQGDTGPQGIAGVDGTNGIDGAMGPQGPQGIQGLTGDTGPAGSNGTNGTNGTNGVGVPVGGTAGQVLSKIDGTDYNTAWTTAAGGSGSPAGSDMQIQYNNSGAFAGATNVKIQDNDLVLLESPAFTSPPADTVKLIARDIAGRQLPAYVGPSGLDSTLQPLLGRNKVGYWSGIAGANTNVGVGIALTLTGTATATAFATTNLISSMNRLDIRATTASTTAVSGFRGGAANYWRGNDAGRGGFTFIARWGIGGLGTNVSNIRGFVGLRASTAAPTDVSPATLTNAIGMGYDSADTTIKIYSAGTVNSAINTGIVVNEVISTNATAQVFEIAMFCPPNAGFINYTVTELGTANTFSTTVTTTTNLPSSTTALNVYGYTSAGGTSTSMSIALCGIYIETDY